MLLTLASLLAFGPQTPIQQVQTPTAGLRAVEIGGSIHLEFTITDANGVQQVVAFDANHPKAKLDSGSWLSKSSTNWTAATVKGSSIVLTGDKFVTTVTVPTQGHVFGIELTLGDKGTFETAPGAMAGVALAPGGNPSKAQSIYVPAGASSSVVTSERFATPLAMATAGGFAVALMPDVADLGANRPLAPVLTIDTDGRMAPGSILSYGFGSYKRDANWNPVLTGEGIPYVAGMSWKCDLLLTNEATAVQEAGAYLWQRDGAARAMKPLPQTVPLRYYTKPTYGLESGGGEEEEEGGEEEEKNSGQWWVQKVAGKEIRAPKNAEGKALLTAEGNMVRFAWGLRWWGDHLLQDSWSEHADEVMNFVLSAPSGATEFDTKTAKWSGSFDRDAEAVTARWKLLYADSFFFVNNDKLGEQVVSTVSRLLDGEVKGLQAIFLQDCLASSSVDEATKNKIRSKLQLALADHVKLATQYANRPADSESIALALYLARVGKQAESRRIIERAFLDQAIWQPTTVAGTEIFGGFVGEHFLSESQSNFTSDLLAATVALDDPVLSARAVAAMRAPLALFNHQTHGISGMALPRELALFRSVSWFGAHGIAEFGPWKGYAEGIGQTLASAAYSLKQFGSAYISPSGMKVCIDGLEFGENGEVFSAFSRNPLGFQSVYPYTIHDARTGAWRELSDPPSVPMMRSVRLALDDKGPYVVVLPGFAVANADQVSGTFVFADGSYLDAKVFPTGLGVRPPENETLLRRIKFLGKYGSYSLNLPPTSLSVGPPSPTLPWPTGWRRMKKLSDVIRTSLTIDDLPIVSTADNGKGSRDSSLTGVIESQAFLMTGVQISCQLKTGGDKNVRVEIIDATMNAPVAVIHGDKHKDGTAVFDLRGSRGANLIIRLIDESGTGSVEAWDFQVVGS